MHFSSWNPNDQEGCSEPGIRDLLGPYELGLLSDRKRIAVERHVLECDSCFEELYETAPLFRAGSATPAPARTGKRTWYVPVAAAAAAAIVVSTLVFRAGDSVVDTKRGAFPEAERIETEGSGGVMIKGGTVVFTWNPVPDAAAYNLLVFDEDGNLVWSGETRNCRAALPADRAALLRPESTCYWKVIGKDGGGREMSSPIRSFRLTG